MKHLPLWNGAAPHSIENDNQTPYMDLYLLPGSGNPCIIVLPGGAYGFVSVQNEGVDICKMLNANGYSAVMVGYRVAPAYHYPVMLLDAQRAIRTVRYSATDYGIDPARIGVIGFSAGGHLCCMTALLADDGLPDGDAIDRTPSRVKTAAPCYAVTSLDAAITHAATRENFLGQNNTDEAALQFSAENMIPADAPPFFLWHTATDDAVNPNCSLRLASALIAKQIPVTLHLFPAGGHGLGLAKAQPLAKDWPQLYIEWLKEYN